jgi:hypothetical protein
VSVQSVERVTATARRSSDNFRTRARERQRRSGREPAIIAADHGAHMITGWQARFGVNEHRVQQARIIRLTIAPATAVLFALVCADAATTRS